LFFDCHVQSAWYLYQLGGGIDGGGPTQYIQAKFLGVCKNDICRLCIPYGIL